MNNESIWQDSYWSFMNLLLPCVTINTPIAKLKKPSENQVSFLLYFNFLTHSNLFTYFSFKFS